MPQESCRAAIYLIERLEIHTQIQEIIAPVRLFQTNSIMR
jgi:hypothetical protein